VNRRMFLARVGIGTAGAAAAPLAPLLAKAPAAQEAIAVEAPTLAAQLARWGLIVKQFPQANEGWWGWTESATGELIGYIHTSGAYFARVVSIGGGGGAGK